MNKVLLRISGIIALVLGITYCITIIGAIVGVPLIVGGSKMMGYSNLSDSEILDRKNSILGWSIFFLFVTVIGGVLGLIYYFSIEPNLFSNFNINTKPSYIQELRELDELRKQGLINEKEYEAKKKKILDI
ncbi:MAG TPA: hypothetical protein GX725_01905 [Mollicutes bacterium]|nr:hypothetical protein [Mollicutes bacterium]